LNDISNDVRSILTQLNDKIYELYELSEDEIDVVDYTINYIVPMARKKKIAEAKYTDIKVYCDVIEEYFNELLIIRNMKIKSHIEESRFYYKLIFEIIEIKNEIQNGGTIGNYASYNDLMFFLSSEKINSSLLINKKIKGFYNNAFFIVKTKDKSNWHRYNAIIDINEFIEDVFSEGGNI
jgi:hypothetical protein